MADIPTDEVLTNEDDRRHDAPATSHWTFTADLRVWDLRQLHAAAVAMYHKEGGDRATPDEAGAESLLGTADEPNIKACLITMLDQSMPGATISESTAEEVE